MNQSLFERILIEEDGTVVGQLAGPYRQLLAPDLVIPASKLGAEIASAFVATLWGVMSANVF